MIINTLTWVTPLTPLDIIKGGNHNLLLTSIPFLLVYALISSKLIPSQSFLNIISYNDSLKFQSQIKSSCSYNFFPFFLIIFSFSCLLQTTTLPILLTTFFMFFWLYFPFLVYCICLLQTTTLPLLLMTFLFVLLVIISFSYLS